MSGALRAVLLLVLLLAGAVAAAAVEPDEILADPALEARARGLSAGFRCVVCQNQSIDESEAPLARDLRIIIRERLVAGDSDPDIRRFIVDRYGSFVLLKPPFELTTLVLWLAPFVILGLGAFYLVGRRRPPAAGAELPMTADEKERLRRLVDQ
ncbi:MAG TPA: cytochrome c-type biogenesis protein [Aestuariivirgaceae bacterium]|nr:cytochrome c-type biogenesis protein [Aestuariivirgaceae bacterium]